MLTFFCCYVSFSHVVHCAYEQYDEYVATIIKVSIFFNQYIEDTKIELNIKRKINRSYSSSFEMCWKLKQVFSSVCSRFFGAMSLFSHVVHYAYQYAKFKYFSTNIQKQSLNIFQLTYRGYKNIIKKKNIISYNTPCVKIRYLKYSGYSQEHFRAFCYVFTLCFQLIFQMQYRSYQESADISSLSSNSKE